MTSVLPARLVVRISPTRRPRPRSVRGTAPAPDDRTRRSPPHAPRRVIPAKRSRTNSVAVQSGAMQFTRTFRSSASGASVCVSRTIAALAVAYSGYECGWVPRPGDRGHVQDRPSAAPAHRSSACWIPSIGPRSATSSTRDHSSTVASGNRAPLPSKALFTRMSSPPSSDSAPRRSSPSRRPPPTRRPLRRAPDRPPHESLLPLPHPTRRPRRQRRRGAPRSLSRFAIALPIPAAAPR